MSLPILIAWGAAGLLACAAPEPAASPAPAPPLAPASIAHHPIPPTTDEVWGYVEDLIEITRRHPETHRRAGTAGEAETRAYLERRLRAFGLSSVKQDPQVFERRAYGAWSLEVAGETVPSFFLRQSAFTPDTGVRAPMVLVEDVLRDDVDVEGRIVVMPIDIPKVPVRTLVDQLADWVHDPEQTLFDGPPIWLIASARNYPGSYYVAARKGAAGFIGILPLETGTAAFYPDSSMIVSPEIPALYVGRFDGQRLIERLRTEPDLEARLTLTGTIERDARTANVMGVLPGNTDDVLLITTHHDTGWEGGVQDASGVAVVLAIARYFAQQPGDIYRQKTLVFNFGTNHFGWDYPASNGIFRDHNPELFARTRAVLGVEHIAKRVEVEDGAYVPTGAVEPHVVWAPRPAFLREIARRAIVANGMTDTIMVRPGAMALIGEAKKYYFWGLPAYQIISAPPYLYDPVDTIDMIAKERLAPVARTSIDVVEQLMNVVPGAWIEP
ncbi:MAG: M28 family peptidase [Myxococcota bacterium]